MTATPATLTIPISIEDTDLAGTLESALMTFLPRSRHGSSGALSDALQYGVFPGGKRLRPILTILGARIFERQAGPPCERVLRAACAVEFVHASSLIIDDLPCMDDADLRRGKPALHCAYGEDLALLTALALLNQAYALFAENPELIHVAAQCIGLDGMIGGQAIDLRSDCEEISLVDRDSKTSGLMRLALTAGAMAQGASREAVAPLAKAGQLLGRAYQMLDDLIDTGTPAKFTGKTADQDTRHGRSSYCTRSDALSCVAEAHRLVEETRRCLLDAFGPTNGVIGLTVFIDTLFESLEKRREDSRLVL